MNQLFHASKHPRNWLDLKSVFCFLTLQLSFQLSQIYLFVHLVLCHFSVKCDFISSANDVWLEGIICFLCEYFSINWLASLAGRFLSFFSALIFFPCLNQRFQESPSHHWSFGVCFFLNTWMLISFLIMSANNDSFGLLFY